jgi:hypothetical protein
VIFLCRRPVVQLTSRYEILRSVLGLECRLENESWEGSIIVLLRLESNLPSRLCPEWTRRSCLAYLFWAYCSAKSIFPFQCRNYVSTLLHKISRIVLYVLPTVCYSAMKKEWEAVSRHRKITLSYLRTEMGREPVIEQHCAYSIVLLHAQYKSLLPVTLSYSYY